MLWDLDSSGDMTGQFSCTQLFPLHITYSPYSFYFALPLVICRAFDSVNLDFTHLPDGTGRKARFQMLGLLAVCKIIIQGLETSYPAEQAY